MQVTVPFPGTQRNVRHSTAEKFRSKGKKLAILAQEFIYKGIVPSSEDRPHQFDIVAIRELQDFQRNQLYSDNRTPLERLAAVQDPIELLIFFLYHDGYSTNGRVGFSLRVGPPGSVNHKRACSRFDALTDGEFREKGKRLGEVAKLFVEQQRGTLTESPPILCSTGTCRFARWSYCRWLSPCVKLVSRGGIAVGIRLFVARRV
jgi:hypothetical protein